MIYVVATSQVKPESRDAFIKGALQLRGKQELFGRRNTLYDPHHFPLAEIVEILPPTEGHS